LEVQIFVDGGAFCEFQFGGLGYLMWQKQPGLADPWSGCRTESQLSIMRQWINPQASAVDCSQHLSR
jgi:hypothetical protein